jgi:hypothetical protein
MKHTIQDDIYERIAYLREEIRNERISYEEVAELQGYAQYIEDDDIELREWIAEEDIH